MQISKCSFHRNTQGKKLLLFVQEPTEMPLLQASKRFHTQNKVSQTPYVVWPEKINNIKVYHHNLFGNLTVQWDRGIVPENFLCSPNATVG